MNFIDLQINTRVFVFIDLRILTNMFYGFCFVGIGVYLSMCVSDRFFRYTLYTMNICSSDIHEIVHQSGSMYIAKLGRRLYLPTGHLITEAEVRIPEKEYQSMRKNQNGEFKIAVAFTKGVLTTRVEFLGMYA